MDNNKGGREATTTQIGIILGNKPQVLLPPYYQPPRPPTTGRRQARIWIRVGKGSKGESEEQYQSTNTTRLFFLVYEEYSVTAYRTRFMYGPNRSTLESLQCGKINLAHPPHLTIQIDPIPDPMVVNASVRGGLIMLGIQQP
jgi:hypothetical protein